MTDCRLLVDRPAAGAWNMAVDEALLQSAAQGRCSVRFYQWSEPTLSLGYFQRFLDRHTHPPSLDCPLVRRPSGGGAIVHDAELTYSVAIPNEHVLARNPQVLYRQIHLSLVEAVTPLVGRSAVLCDATRGLKSDEPFLCFQRRAAGDVLVDQVKIAGSAQRRRRGAVIQHGSILLRKSPAAPELQGLAELTVGAVNPAELADFWAQKLAFFLGFHFYADSSSATELEIAGHLARTKYSNTKWNRLR